MPWAPSRFLPSLTVRKYSLTTNSWATLRPRRLAPHSRSSEIQQTQFESHTRTRFVKRYLEKKRQGAAMDALPDSLRYLSVILALWESVDSDSGPTAAGAVGAPLLA